MRKELQTVKKKEVDKELDETQEYLQTLQEKTIAGRGTLKLRADRSRVVAGHKKNWLDFTHETPKYDGNPEKVFKWFEKLETLLDTYDRETIQNDKGKKMLLSCITGSARQDMLPV